MSNLYPLIADTILIVHSVFITFVLVGQGCVVVGCFRNWRWVRNLTFRVCHILAIGIVVAQAWANQVCPLTIWENALRHAAGGQSYPGTFVEHWVGRLVYYDAPQWVFTVAYSLFGAVVLFSWAWVKPERDMPNK
ncbi:MAG: DUF2784 domain-containing protein [Kiritimatiellia bacterium]|nr:DUF2784 domain-containing protein [Kiritimatiellia bacterium]